MIEPRQQRFVDEYLKDLNATQAAIRAGYSKKTSKVQGSRLLTNAAVAEAINKRKKVAAQRLEMSAEEIRQALSKIGRCDVRKLFAADGSMKPIHEVDDDTAAAISGFEVLDRLQRAKNGKKGFNARITKVKTYDKVAALTQLARIHGMHQDKVVIEGKLTLEALIMGVIAREEAEKAPQPPTIEGTVTEEKPE